MTIQTTIIDGSNVEEVEVSSNLIDIVYCLIKETYLGRNVVSIKNPLETDAKALGDFLTYILAYPKGVKTPTVIVSGTSDASGNVSYGKFKGETIICFSGGVDSTGAILNAISKGNKPIALWCDYGQPYRRTEKKAVESICFKLNIILIEVVLDISDLIAIGGNRFGHVFPARNLLICAIGLCFLPKRLELAGLCDELTVPDKSLRMYKEFGALFGTPLSSPFVNKTKTDVLCMWQSQWDRYLNANETISCYGEEGECQNCSSCAKREIAFVASGYHKEYPLVFSNQHELIENHWFSRVDLFQYERRADMLIALNCFIDKLTPKLQQLVNINVAKYNEEVARRKEQLKVEGGTIE